jgi:hypothetical protein
LWINSETAQFYIEPVKLEGMTEDERNEVFDECFEHNDHLGGHDQVIQGRAKLTLVDAKLQAPQFLRPTIAMWSIRN